MTEAPILIRGLKDEARRSPKATNDNVLSGSSFKHLDAVEILSPDGYCAALLVRCATPMFAARIVAGSSWVVRFEPPPRGRDRVIEFLAVIEEWLQAVRLPCAKLLYGGTSRLIGAGSAPRHTREGQPTPDTAA